MLTFSNPRSRYRWRNRAVVVAAVLAWAQWAWPQSSAQPASPAPTGAYRIAGRVVNGATGEPIPRATVAALAEEDRQLVRSVESDADGRFSIDRLPAGKYPLTASKRGFRTAFYDEHDEFNTAIVTGEGQETDNLIFQLMPGAVLHGVVTADGGDPAENASILLFKRDDTEQGHGEIREVDGATTDDTGAYEFSNLAAGEYYVAVTASPWYAMRPPAGAARQYAANDSLPLDVAYPVTFFDSTTEEASASPIMLTAGGRTQADITLHAVPALHLQVAAPPKIKGMAIARPELRQMIFGMQVSAESAGFLDALQTGFAEFNGVAPGHYQLVQGDPPRILELDATSNQQVDPNVGAPAVSVSGVLRSASGVALPENVTLILSPIGGRIHGTNTTNAHRGSFKFDAVGPGEWSLWAENQGKALDIVSVSTGESSVAGSQFIVKDRPLSLVVTVSASLSRIEGFARKDGKGAAGAMIVLVPKQPSAYSTLVRRDQSDSDGSFSLRDVAAGQYTLIAVEDAWKLDLTQRESILRYLARGVEVTVSDRTAGLVQLSGSLPVQPR